MSDKELTAGHTSEQRESNQYRFSIIVPVLNEADQINSLIEYIRSQGFERFYELLVVDGDPQGSTVNALQDKKVTAITTEKGRGRQMNAGAATARGEILLFLHADTTRLRSRLNRIPYGDQAIFIRKSYFEKIGRFKEIPLMEDIDLMRRIKKDRRKIYILKDRVSTSPRRWEKEGILYTTIRNQLILALYYLGVSPEKLAKYYYRRH
jgi:glycosyltransferase involved in cell wall biosynthesis